MIEAICVALLCTLALGAWAWKRRAYRRGYQHGELDASIGRQVRAAFAPPCWCGAPTDPAVSLTRRQCAVRGTCLISGQPVTPSSNGPHRH